MPLDYDYTIALRYQMLSILVNIKFTVDMIFISYFLLTVEPQQNFEIEIN